jgi:hypothetical protein
MRFRGVALLLFALAACGERPGGLADGPLARPLFQGPSLPPLASLGRNGMRVSISPSDGDYDFLVDFVPQPLGCYLPLEPIDQARLQREGCRWVEVRYGRFGRHALAGQIRFDQFIVPEGDYRDVVGQFELQARNWSDPHGTLDGTAIGVELYREGRLRSLSSNDAGPASPTATLGVAVHGLLLAYGPTGTVPRSSSFMITPVEPDYPCMGTDFVTPDPDGFGTGDDACARQRASRAAPPARSAGGAAR